MFNKESARARSTKSGSTTPIKKGKVKIGCQDLGGKEWSGVKKVRDIK